MQLFGKDTLLNFGLKTPVILGTIGNTMILGSFVCVLAPFLIVNPLNWIVLIIVTVIAKSAGSVMAIMAGLGIYLWKKFTWGRYICVMLLIFGLLFACSMGKFKTAFGAAGRIPVYIKTIELSLKRPFGYGIATNKVVFPALCGDAIRKQQPGREWNTTHNDFLQILFETGFLGFILFFGWIISIIIKVRDTVKVAGLVMLATLMIPAFPTRMCQSVLILLMYLAYVEKGDTDGSG